MTRAGVLSWRRVIARTRGPRLASFAVISKGDPGLVNPDPPNNGNLTGNLCISNCDVTSYHYRRIVADTLVGPLMRKNLLFLLLYYYFRDIWSRYAGEFWLVFFILHSLGNWNVYSLFVVKIYRRISYT